MTLQQLKYMITISEKGSITEAAKELFISQPSLSEAVKELEKEINIKIFYRWRAGVAPTQEGIEFLGYARQVVEQMELLESRYLYFRPVKKHFRIANIFLALILLECVYSILK
ncbi:MAG: LysR family transcriptional regulator [Oscillospiraceae bacterium]|nr:LysR family transcriptional regulator [Oscillospiraceae bacterium]